MSDIADIDTSDLDQPAIAPPEMGDVPDDDAPEHTPMYRRTVSEHKIGRAHV